MKKIFLFLTILLYTTTLLSQNFEEDFKTKLIAWEKMGCLTLQNNTSDLDLETNCLKFSQYIIKIEFKNRFDDNHIETMKDYNTLTEEFWDSRRILNKKMKEAEDAYKKLKLTEKEKYFGDLIK